jgi:small subunit ribosomal protein S15
VTLSREKTQEIVGAYRLHEKDTGSPEVQVALLSARIAYMTEHLSRHKRDYHSRHGLMRLVGQRKRLLDYLRRKDVEAYRQLIANLSLRK